jgi:transcriptional regulator NrdR family protein
MQCPTCNSGSIVSTTVQFNGEVKRHRKCKSCDKRFVTLEKLIESAPVGRRPKPRPVPDERGLYTPAAAVSLKMQKVVARRKNEDRVSSYYIEDDYE